MNFLQPNWPAPEQVKAYTTVRSAWGENGLDPNGEQSIHTLETLFSIPEKPIWLTQTHSTTVVEATHENIGTQADASFTEKTNRVCVVVTGDCLPVLICNKQGTYVSAIHAGWRGLAAGIIEAALKNAPYAPSDLLVWLGPAISQKNYEVGKDVYDAFTHVHPHSAGAFAPAVAGKWLADLYELARIRLKEQGIIQVYGGNFCTYSQSDLFYSYRRDHDKRGQMASLIWITA